MIPFCSRSDLVHRQPNLVARFDRPCAGHLHSLHDREGHAEAPIEPGLRDIVANRATGAAREVVALDRPLEALPMPIPAILICRGLKISTVTCRRWKVRWDRELDQVPVRGDARAA